MVSREMNPFSPTVVTVGSVHGGEATSTNVIPEIVKISGTYRSLSNTGLNVIKQRIADIIHGVAAVNRCTATITHPYDDYPPTVNDEESSGPLAAGGQGVVGAENVRPMDPLLGGEDFAFFQQRIPGCFSFLGVSAADWETRRGVTAIPKFKVDESAHAAGRRLAHANHSGFAGPITGETVWPADYGCL